jgi:pyruvate/2-oxoacid:ferredoxin oxidoreductase beta subunit
MENLSIKYKKADSFYSTFERKGKGAIATHYCPGCSHGVIQKLIATAIDELKIKDQTIFYHRWDVLSLVTTILIPAILSVRTVELPLWQQL